jgi:uncharacterized membrane protein YphA (DoxX/SURF4 family)
MSIVRRVGQACLGAVFVSGGVDTLRNPGPRADKPGTRALAERLGTDAPTLVRANAAAMVAGGLALATDHLPRLASFGLAASLLPTTVVGHPFWRESDPKQRAAQRGHFVKNVSVFGGCLLYATSPRRRPRVTAAASDDA